jgi:hypothetical protein
VSQTEGGGGRSDKAQPKVLPLPRLRPRLDKTEERGHDLEVSLKTQLD